jgi:hypothetical protein
VFLSWNPTYRLVMDIHCYNSVHKVQPAEWHCEAIVSRILLDYPCCEFGSTLSLPRHKFQMHAPNEQEYDIRMIHVSDSSPRDDSPS